MSDGQLEHIPTAPLVPFPLGRSILWHDARNRQHRALDATPAVTRRARTVPWRTRDTFDQIGPSCTVAANIGLCRTAPLFDRFRRWWPQYDTEQDRFAFYADEVRKWDPWPGEDYEGSSTDAPAKALRSRGQIAAWKWLFGEAELEEWVTFYGPAAVGTVWYDSMFTPDANAYLTVDSRSGVAGGHAWRIIFYSRKRRAYRMNQSWGLDWGEHGRAWVRQDDMRHLLAADGEAMTIMATAA